MTDPLDQNARDLLARAVPPPPPTGRWAKAVRVRRHRQRIAAGTVAFALILAVPTAIHFLARDQWRGEQVASEGAVFFQPGTEVYGDALIFSRGEETVLCIGPMNDMYPPDCSGPALVGDFSWEQVPFEQEGQVRWSSAAHRVQGFFDPGEGEHGAFRLTRAVADVPAESHEEAGSEEAGSSGGEDPDFPQLCDDPLRGADPDLTGDDAEVALGAALEELDLVDAWVSNGRDAYNIVVDGDAEAVHSELREVWGGELCVESAPGALTMDERMEVAEQVAGAVPAGVLHGWDPSGPGGGINLNVLYLDTAIAEAIREAAGGVAVHVYTELAPVGFDRMVVLD